MKVHVCIQHDAGTCWDVYITVQRGTQETFQFHRSITRAHGWVSQLVASSMNSQHHVTTERNSE